MRQQGTTEVHHNGGYPYQRRFAQGWAVLWLIDLLILASGFVLTYRYRGIRFSGIGALKVAAVMVYQQLFLLGNQRTILCGENLEHLWGAANLLSLSRGLMIAVLAGFLFTRQPAGIIGWLPALLYTLLAVLDYIDGYYARRTNTQTRMGGLLDQEYDGLGILVAVVLVVQWGHLPAVFLFIALAKYVFAWGTFWRKLRSRPLYPLVPSYMRRRLAGFQMGILAVFLWPIARMPGTLLAELIIGVPFMLGFLRDWLLVSGTLDPADEGYRRIKEIFYTVGRVWLPSIIRAVLVAVAVQIAVTTLRRISIPAAWIAQILPQAELVTLAYAAARLLLLVLLIAGRFTSASALLLLLLESLRIFLTRLDPWGAAIVSAALLLYLFGPGPYRLGVRYPLGRSSNQAGT